MIIPISIDRWEAMSPLAGALAAMLPENFEHFCSVARGAAADAESLYRSYLSGHPLPGGTQLNSPSKTVGSVYRRETAMLAWAIGNSSEAARGIENGVPERDMKACLATAPRARRAKPTAKDPAGHNYLVIPFRHATSDAKVNAQGRTGTGMHAMPAKVYGMVKQMEFSTRIGMAGTRTSATGYTVPSWRYDWQGYVSKKALLAKGLDEASAKRYQGMVRMSKGGHSSYMTFRIMSERSPASSWIRKEQKAIPALATAIRQATEANSAALSAAFVADVEVLIR